MAETFQEQYASLLKEVFREQARQQLAQGEQSMQSMDMARSYAGQGKPDFALAYLLESDGSDEEKREVLALSYEQRAHNSDQKAAQLATQFHRTFPLIKLEAQIDRAAARAIRDGHRLDKMPPAGSPDTTHDPPVG